MAIIKCSTCGKNVTDNEPKCLHCGNDLDKNVYCPKCGSADTSVLLKWKNGEVKRFFIAALVDAIFNWHAAHRAYEETEYSTSVKRICNDCGKKFKVE